jgi:hypothetical protein
MPMAMLAAVDGLHLQQQEFLGRRCRQKKGPLRLEGFWQFGRTAVMFLISTTEHKFFEQ